MIPIGAAQVAMYQEIDMYMVKVCTKHTTTILEHICKIVLAVKLLRTMEVQARGHWEN